MPPDDTIIPGAPGDPRAHFPDDAPGTQVGPYKLVSQLGEGGFGTVWLAERREPFVQQVALKIVKAGMDSKAVVARFEQERQALAVMDHPHVAKVLDGGLTAQGRPYFAMEYVRGEPINDFCDRRKLAVRDRLSLFLQVCEAVQHAHTKGIIHRDLKPSNVLVSMGTDDRPSAKVIDFGIAKAVSGRMTEQTLFTETGQMMGTPEYMSPEQADPGAVDIDTRTDVYSLGVILYELLTGVPPFDPVDLRSRAYREIQRVIREEDPPTPSARLSTIATKDAELATRIGQARKEPVTALASLLKSELEWIPLKAMRKERQERYDSPADLARDVANYLEGRPLVAAPESTAYRVRKYVRRNRGFVAAATAVVAALVVGLGLAAWQWREAVASEAAALHQLERSTNLLGVMAIGNALDAARRHDAVACRRELTLAEELGRSDLFAARLASAWCDQSIAGPLGNPGGDGLRVAFSPDGKTIVSSAGKALQLWDVSTGNPLGEPMRGHEDPVGSVAFSPDGKLLASGSLDHTIRLWDVSTRRPLGEPLRGHELTVTGVMFSPDGTRLLSTGDDRSVRVWDIGSRAEAVRQMGRHEAPVGGLISPAFNRTGDVLACSDGRNIRLCESLTGAALGNAIPVPDGEVSCMAMDPGGTVLAAGVGRVIYVWDLRSRKLLGEPLRGHEGWIRSVAFSPDGRTLASGATDNTIRLWNLASGRALDRVLVGHQDRIEDLAFSPDGHLLSSVSKDGAIRLWHPSALESLSAPLAGHQARVMSLAFSFDGTVMAAGDSKRIIRLWHVPTGRALGLPLKGHSGDSFAWISRLVFSQDGTTLASACQGEVRLWDVRSGEARCDPIAGDDHHVRCMVISNDGKLLVTSGDGRNIGFWDSRTGAPVGEPIRGLAAPVDGLALSADGATLYGLGFDRVIRSWDFASRQPKGQVSLIGDQDAMLLRLGAGGALAVTVADEPGVGGQKGSIVVWDGITGQAMTGPLEGHGNFVLSVAFSPDGRTLASGGDRAGTSIRLWDLAAGKSLGEPMEARGTTCVAFSPDGRTLAAASSERLVRLWHTTPVRERYPDFRAWLGRVEVVRGLLATRIANVDDSIESVRALDAEVRADPRFTGDLRTAALIVVGEVDLDRQALRERTDSPAK